MTKADLNGERLRKYLASVLPEYMVPTVYVRVDTFPLTPNGKVDRGALPDFQPALVATVDFVAPRYPVETTIATAWCEALGLNQVSVFDDYFQVGGNSVSSIRIASRLRAHFGIEIPLRYLFEFATVAELAKQISALLALRDRANSDLDESGELDGGTI